MNLEEFRNLDSAEGDQNAARCDVVGHLIAGQLPWLRRGVNMTGPIGRYLKGREFTDADYVYDSDGFTPLGTVPQVSPAFTIKATIDQIRDYHPWLDLGKESAEGNYFHLYQVAVMNAFGDKQAGSEVIMTYQGHPFKVTLTQNMIDESSYVLIRLALSK
jgi:hypothetical protein